MGTAPARVGPLPRCPAVCVQTGASDSACARGVGAVRSSRDRGGVSFQFNWPVELPISGTSSAEPKSCTVGGGAGGAGGDRLTSDQSYLMERSMNAETSPSSSRDNFHAAKTVNGYFGRVKARIPCCLQSATSVGDIKPVIDTPSSNQSASSRFRRTSSTVTISRLLIFCC